MSVKVFRSSTALLLEVGVRSLHTLPELWQIVLEEYILLYGKKFLVEKSKARSSEHSSLCDDAHCCNSNFKQLI